MVEKMKLTMMNIIKFAFPFLFCQSWEDITSVTLILPKYTIKNIITLACLYLYHLVFITDGLFYLWINTRFLFSPTTILGPFVGSVHLICAAGVGECALIRSYCLYKMIRYGKGSIDWQVTLRKIKQNDQVKLFKIMQFLFFQVALTTTTIVVLNHVVKLLVWSTTLDYVVNISWIFVHITLLRYTPIEIPYVYIVAYFCYSYVKEQMDSLLKHFSEPLMSIDLVPEYLRLMKSINQVNHLMKLISLANGLTAVPYTACAIVILLTQPENNLQFIIKCCFFIPAVAYSVRGMVMTIVLAHIDRKSKTLYTLLASRIARGEIKGVLSIKHLILIMDDLAGDKNHLVMREYSGSPSDQMDVMVNVLSIAQFVMLVMQFSLKFVL